MTVIKSCCMEFECPVCGRKYYGFSGMESDDTHNHYCKTFQCRFEWNSKDNWKYFVEVTKRKSTTEKEYEKLRKR